MPAQHTHSLSQLAGHGKGSDGHVTLALMLLCMRICINNFYDVCFCVCVCVCYDMACLCNASAYV